MLSQKMFGVFEHEVLVSSSPLLRGFDDTFPVPVSRHTETRIPDLEGIEDITVLAHSKESGLCMVEDRKHRHVCMFNHLEYDATSLRDEYQRDITQGLDIQVPAHYFPGDDPSVEPRNSWRSHAHLFIANWINELYQNSPFDLSKIGDGSPNTMTVKQSAQS